MQTCAYADAKAAFGANPIPWASRKSIAFWRGQTTGWYDAQGNTVHAWGEPPRYSFAGWRNLMQLIACLMLV